MNSVVKPLDSITKTCTIEEPGGRGYMHCNKVAIVLFKGCNGIEFIAILEE